MTLICCIECEKVYVVHERPDGSYVLTTDDGNCACGNTSFREVDWITDD